jgi:hypothetical protein
MLTLHVAEKPRPIAICEDAEVLGGVGAAEVEGVEAGLAFDHVTAVAGVPDDPVVAGAADQRVVAAAADDGVVAVAAVDRETDLAGSER